MLVVPVCAFARVGEDFIGFYDFSETVCCRAGGMVGVVLFHEEEVSCFYFFCGCRAGEIEYFVGSRVGVGGPGNRGL